MTSKLVRVVRNGITLRDHLLRSSARFRGSTLEVARRVQCGLDKAVGTAQYDAVEPITLFPQKIKTGLAFVDTSVKDEPQFNEARIFDSLSAYSVEAHPPCIEYSAGYRFIARLKHVKPRLFKYSMVASYSWIE